MLRNSSRKASVLSRKKTHSPSLPKDLAEFTIIAAVIQKHQFGTEDQLVFLSLCCVCHKPITDFDEANLIVCASVDEDWALPRIGSIGNSPLHRIPGDVYAVHLACEGASILGRRKPWARLSNIIKADQGI